MKEKRKCPQCGEMFEVDHWLRKKNCSNKCKMDACRENAIKAARKKYDSKRRSEVLKKKWAKDKEKMLKKRNTEEYREKISKTTIDRFQNDEEFKERHREGCRRGTTEEKKNKLREISIKRIQNNEKTITRPNRVISDLLKRLSIEHKMEYPIEDICRSDIVLPEKKIAIEILGDYWHCNPKLFDRGSNCITHSQKGNIRRDEEKKKKLEERYTGFRFIYLWESDVYFNLEKCREIILDSVDRFWYPSIRVTECMVNIIDRETARKFCHRYHYLPSFPVVVKKSYGLYFQGSLIGVGAWGMPTNKNALNVLGGEGLELSRFCLVDGLPKNTASYFLGKMIKEVKGCFPNLVGLVSYSDDSVHLGTIYKATNWESLGSVKGTYFYVNDRGEKISRQKVYTHCKGLNMVERVYVEKIGLKRVDTSTKTKFVYWFNR